MPSQEESGHPGPWTGAAEDTTSHPNAAPGSPLSPQGQVLSHGKLRPKDQRLAGQSQMTKPFIQNLSLS